MEKELISILNSFGAVHVGFLNRDQAQFGEWIKPWLKKGFHGDMEWMTRNGQIRSDPCSIETDGKSIISLAFPYLTRTPDRWRDQRLISNYAWGEDYHLVLRKRLKMAIQKISAVIPEFKGRLFVDSAPLPEKLIAASCGVGWIGKNSLLISPQWGSFIFLAEIVCNLDLESTPAISDGCGECEMCVSACPNQAILTNRSINARNCVSYLTIEKNKGLSARESKRIDYHLFGCDCCQMACPWNKGLTLMEDSPFSCDSKWLDVDLHELAELSQTRFDELKIKSPLKRLKLEGIRRNAHAILKNTQLPANLD
jgi:epoxyqueuosine reductase